MDIDTRHQQLGTTTICTDMLNKLANLFKHMHKCYIYSISMYVIVLMALKWKEFTIMTFFGKEV